MRREESFHMFSAQVMKYFRSFSTRDHPPLNLDYSPPPFPCCL